jgi:hypothetical protein
MFYSVISKYMYGKQTKNKKFDTISNQIFFKDVLRNILTSNLKFQFLSIASWKNVLFLKIWLIVFMIMFLTNRPELQFERILIKNSSNFQCFYWSEEILHAGGFLLTIKTSHSCLPLNNISIISWRSVLLVEETRVPGENHCPAASHWQTLSHNVSSTHLLTEIWTCKSIIFYYIQNKPFSPATVALLQ